MKSGRILERLLQLVPVLLGVAVVVFFMTTLTPGDPVEMILGTEQVTAADIAALRDRLGLDDPIPVRFAKFMGNILTGDFGTSYYHSRPVIDLIAERMPATIELTLVSMLIAIALAIPLGTLSAVKRDSAVDKVLSGISFLAVSMPAFWFGILLILLFAVNLGLLPVGGRVSLALEVPRTTGFLLLDSVLAGRVDTFWSVLRHLLLPALTMGLAASALLMRVARSSMVEVLSTDYILFARAKGLSRYTILFRHALKNALIPVVTMAAIEAGGMLGGSVIIETVFAWPGLGSLVGEAIFARNYPLVQTAVLLFALIYVFANFFADLLYTRLNPRIEL